jgi:DNA polymerase-3 subunit epsilon
MPMAMEWLRHLLGNPVPLSALQRSRLRAIESNIPLPSDLSGISLAQARWVAADVESSGLDVWNDQLIAIGAVVVSGTNVQLGESHEVVLKQTKISSQDNILIHRISGRDQQSGEDPVEALLTFLEFVGNSPLVGYHANFDRIMLERACKKYLGTPVEKVWLDLAALAPALVDTEHGSAKTRAAGRGHPLDWWLERYRIEVSARHNAAADALATAQLFGILLSTAEKQGVSNVESVMECAKDYEWLRRR